MSSLSIRTVASVRHAGELRPRSFVGRVFAYLAQEYLAHRDLRRIQSLDGRMLHDIGLSAGGLEDAVRNGRPFDQQPGHPSARRSHGLPGSAHTEWR